MQERVLVCVAWPYANGPLHLGHVAGSLLPPDVFARYQRMRGRDVAMVSGSDMHGTPITVAAEKAGETPEAFAKRYNESHKASLAALSIRFDRFTSTATENHRAVVHDVFRTLLSQGDIVKRTMTAPYDPQARRFLPDRYVEGTCPHCAFTNARGDQCDNCGRTLDPQELKDPRSKLSGAAPEYRETEHFFLRLPAFEERLKAWVAEQAQKAGWRSNTVNFTQNWLKEGLKDRPITRDMLYGVPIPLDGYDDKRIYVWFEAVIGYLSATKELHPQGWERFWLEPASRHYYFLGKDNIPFHTIIWPSMLMGYSDGTGRAHNLPWDVPANEFMNFGGAKLSKSRGNLITVDEILQDFEPDAVRYYLSVNLPERGDTEWSWTDFVAKVNDELVAALGNYANRVLTFTQREFGGVPDLPEATLARFHERDDAAAGKAHKDALDASEEAIAAKLAKATRDLDAVRLKDALQEIMSLARLGNARLTEHAPWTTIKEGAAGRERAAGALHWHLGLLKTLAVALQPYLPTVSDELWRQLGEAGSLRASAEPGGKPLAPWPTARLTVRPGQTFGEIRPLVRKIDPKSLEQETKPMEQKEPHTSTMTQAGGVTAGNPPAPNTKPPVTIDDFAKLDLRVGVVLSCEPHPKADKLWVLQVDIGNEKRQILAGLREHVQAEELVGKRIVVIANLQPRQIRGLKSQGMVLAAEADGIVAPLTPAKDIAAGAGIK